MTCEVSKEEHRFFFLSSRRRHTIWPRDWSSEVCSSELLQRHRLLTLEWQRLSPEHGFDTPEVIADAGMTDAWHRVMEDSATTWTTLADQAGPDVAQYA